MIYSHLKKELSLCHTFFSMKYIRSTALQRRRNFQIRVCGLKIQFLWRFKFNKFRNSQKLELKP